MQIDQLTVNEYGCGVGLSPHIDTHSAFTGAIISLSVGGPAVMVMRREEKQQALWLPPRSLLVMGGESRYAWWVPGGLLGPGGWVRGPGRANGIASQFCMLALLLVGGRS